MKRWFTGLLTTLWAVLFMCSPAPAGSRLGAGPAQGYDWTSNMFADAFKHARVWGQYDKGYVPYSGAMVDGFPVGPHQVACLTDIPVKGGTFTLSFTSGNLRGASINGVKAKTIARSGLTTVCTWNLPDQMALWVAIDGDNMKGHKLLQPNCTSSDIWIPQFVAKAKRFGFFRGMDLQGTNAFYQDGPAGGNQVTTWESRPKMTDANWQQGVPIEALIDLANKAGIDVWYNVPHMASDEFIRRSAEMFKSGLDPRLRVKWEYSNECWNWDFKQTKWLYDWGMSQLAQDPALATPWAGDAWSILNNAYAKQSLRVAQIVKPILGDRAQVLLCLQNVRVHEQIPSIAGYFAKKNIRMADWFYAFASAPYAQPVEPLWNKKNATVDEFLAAMDVNETKGVAPKNFPANFDWKIGHTANVTPKIVWGTNIGNGVYLSALLGMKFGIYEFNANLGNSTIPDPDPKMYGKPIQVKAKLDILKDRRFAVDWMTKYVDNAFEAGVDFACLYQMNSQWTMDNANFGAWADPYSTDNIRTQTIFQLADKWQAPAYTPPTTQPSNPVPEVPVVIEAKGPVLKSEWKSVTKDTATGKYWLYIEVKFDDGSQAVTTVEIKKP